MDTFDYQQLQEMDVSWLTQNGWTIPGNLAYRRILRDFNQTGVLQLERIEQVLMQYQLDDAQIAKTKEELANLIALKRELSELKNLEQP